MQSLIDETLDYMAQLEASLTTNSDGLTPSQVAVERSLDLLENSWKIGVEQITTDIREIDEKLEANFHKFNEKFASIRSKLGAKFAVKTIKDANRIQWRTALVDFSGALEDRIRLELDCFFNFDDINYFALILKKKTKNLFKFER